MATLYTVANKGAPLTPTEADFNMALLNIRTGEGWDDLVAPMEIQTGSPDAPTLTEWMEHMWLPEFNNSNDLSVLGKFHVNHRYKLGTMMYPHLHFSPNDDAASGVVRLGFRYKVARRHDSTGQIKFTNAVTLIREFNIPLNSAGTHFVVEMPESEGIPSTHLEPDVMILMETFRFGGHVNDTFTGSIWCMTHDLHYELDRDATINRAPNFYA